LVISLVVFPPLVAHITDPRDQDKIIYSLPCLAYTAILLFLCQLKARRQVGYLLRTFASARLFNLMFGSESCPHGDTLNRTFKRLCPDQLQEVVCSMVETLIRRKLLYPYRFLDTYYVIAVDGTGFLHYRTRHCAHCLHRTVNGVTYYYHPVLEAKLVTHNGFAFSIMTEFIENAHAHVTTQDCELKAFYRLCERLKKRFPRLPLLLTLDGLYAGGPTMERCERNSWKYMIVLKDDHIKSVNEEFDGLTALQPENRLTVKTGIGGRVKRMFQWVTEIAYTDDEKRNHTLNVLQCVETTVKNNGQTNTKKYKWITNLAITSKSVHTIATEGGRIRWKVENEGFNIQKNGGYELEHAYSNNHNAAKIFYLFLQIAHIIAQLINRGSLLKKLVSTPLGSHKNFAFRLLEAMRNARIIAQDLEPTTLGRIQIRFDTS